MSPDVSRTALLTIRVPEFHRQRTNGSHAGRCFVENPESVPARIEPLWSPAIRALGAPLLAERPRARMTTRASLDSSRVERRRHGHPCDGLAARQAASPAAQWYRRRLDAVRDRSDRRTCTRRSRTYAPLEILNEVPATFRDRGNLSLQRGGQGVELPGRQAEVNEERALEICERLVGSEPGEQGSLRATVQIGVGCQHSLSIRRSRQPGFIRSSHHLCMSPPLNGMNASAAFSTPAVARPSPRSARAALGSGPTGGHIPGRRTP